MQSFLRNSLFNMYATFLIENLGKKQMTLASYLTQSFTEYILMNSLTPFHEPLWPPFTTILHMLCSASSFWKQSKFLSLGERLSLLASVHIVTIAALPDLNFDLWSSFMLSG